MTDNLDRMRADLNDAAVAGDWRTFDDNLTSLIATMRQLRRENERAWSQAGSDRVDLSTALQRLEAARAELRQAQADAGWWHATVANYVTSATSEDRRLLREVLADALIGPHPGVQLLKELEAARAVVEVARREKHLAPCLWTRPGEDTIALSDFEIALDRALAAYDETVSKK